MKGVTEVPVTALAMVVLLIVVVAFAYYFLFKEEIEKAPPTPIEALAICKTHSSCLGNVNGTMCISINNQPYGCGCLSSLDCAKGGPVAAGKLRCVNNVCM